MKSSHKHLWHLCLAVTFGSSVFADTLTGDSNVTGSLDVEGPLLQLGAVNSTTPAFTLDSYLSGDLLQTNTAYLDAISVSRASWVWRGLAGQSSAAAMSLDVYYDDAPQLHVNGTISAPFITGTEVISGGFPVLTSSNLPSIFSNFPNNLTFGNASAHTIGIVQSGSGVGRELSISAGTAASGTNLAGGNLIFSSGGATGTGASTMEFRTAAIGLSGAGGNTAATRLKIGSYGAVGIGADALTGSAWLPYGGLDVAWGGVPATLLLGADSNASTRTNNTIKTMRMGVAPYSVSHVPMTAMVASTLVASNELYIGGGTGSMNTATRIRFYTAANNTTVSGTERMNINHISIGAGDGIVGSGTFSQVVVGRHNDTRTNDGTTNHTDGVFIVGAGTGVVSAPDEKRNALRVRSNGAVLIQASGDISMGEFASGEAP